ncbi:MAG: CCA tRNA nucleotidyltransferase [Pseudobdellovibrionaceae bacterium]|jgi:poly(A) polymerase
MSELKQKPHLHASWIDPAAKEIVRNLQNQGFTSYLVGGCVRDLLAGVVPKDFDIATNAEPNQVRKHVRGAYVIGKRFRLVLVKRGAQQYEVATFRREMQPEDLETTEETVEAEETTAPVGDNFFGTAEQDALRRDFTINALFYDPIKNNLLDYAKGLPDIESRTIRMIGDPAQRIVEDPIRSLRAIRLAHKLGFHIEGQFRENIRGLADRVALSVLPRRREEYLKFLRLSDPLPALAELFDLELMKVLLPTLTLIWSDSEKLDAFRLYYQARKSLTEDASIPIQVYLPFIFACWKALENEPNAKGLLNNLMKDELGMFKSEQAFILDAMEMSSNFPAVSSFLKRGHRRRSGFLKTESLIPALIIAEKDFLMQPSEILFWKQQLGRAFMQPFEPTSAQPSQKVDPDQQTQ